MKPRILWILVAVLLTGYFIVDYGFSTDHKFSFELGLLGLLFDVLSQVLPVLVVGATVGALAALVPFRRLAFVKKFTYTFPLGCALILTILILSFGYIAYLERVKGIKVGSLVTYNEVALRPGLDCSSVHDGSFEIGALIIFRNGLIQRQTNKHSGETKEFNVVWLSDCEYVLTSSAEPDKAIKVKIVDVSEEGYRCFVATGMYATAYEVKRIPSAH